MGLPSNAMLDEDLDEDSHPGDEGEEFFNQILTGVEPSINDDTLRDSIKYSFVSSESEAL